MSIFIKKKDLSTHTSIHNAIIADYLPSSSESALKVYIYGIYLTENNIDLPIESICETLNLTENEFMQSTQYWKDLGLMEFVSNNPLQISFISPENAKPNVKYKKEKYEDFNNDLQELFPSRQLLPTEYNEYYYLIENCHIEPQALYLIVAYCVRLKGTSIKPNYIITVAKEWIGKGILNVHQVEKRLSENEAVNESVKDVLRALKRAGMPDIESRESYIKWTKSWGYDHDAIIYSATNLNNGTIAKLDSVLSAYFNLSILTKEDMENFKTRKKMLYDTAKNVVSRLGLFYSSLEYVVEIYITKWNGLGYSSQSLTTIAHNCFIKDIRTLEGMSYEIKNNLFSNGILDDNSVTDYYNSAEKINLFLSKILSNISIKRAVNNFDRDLLATWTDKWGFSLENIETASVCLSAKATSVSYISNFLARALEHKYFTKGELENFAKSYIHNGDKSKTEDKQKSVMESDLSEVLNSGNISYGEIE